jgi:lysophospholipase L1-like esterase
MPFPRAACKLLVVAFVLTAAPVAGNADAPLAPASKKDDSWQARHKALVERAKKGDAALVFLGDSLTQGWELEGSEAWQKRFTPLKAANFGITGDKAQNVLWRIAEGKELQGLKPRVVVLLAGTNNLGSNRHGQLTLAPDPPQAIAECIAAVTGQLRKELPDSRILLLGILPRAAGADAPVRERIQDVNKRLASLTGDNLRFLDLGSKFLDKDGRIPEELMPDALHLSPKGYEILADALAPVLEDMLKKAGN